MQDPEACVYVVGRGRNTYAHMYIQLAGIHMYVYIVGRGRTHTCTAGL